MRSISSRGMLWHLRLGPETTCVRMAPANSRSPQTVVAWTYAQAVVPRNGKHPPDERAEDGLSDGQGDNVALLGKKPRHADPTDKGHGNQNRVGPVQSAEDRAGQQGRQPAIFDERHQAVVEQRLKSYLLEQAESKVIPEAAERNEMGRKPARHAKRETHRDQHDRANSKEDRGLARGGPDVVGTPAESLRRVAMHQKTNREPQNENHPRVPRRELQSPDIACDQQRHSHYIEEGQPAQCCGTHGASLAETLESRARRVNHARTISSAGLRRGV